MGKGDGKKNRKKKSTSEGTTTPSSESHSPPPLRVTNSINIPIKRQIQWAKLNQEIKNSGTSFRQPRKRTAYRKQIDEDSHAEMLDIKRSRNSHVDWEVILSNGNGTNAGPLMLVDGYNVIYQWSRLKKHMVKGNTAMARDLLVRDLEDLHHAKGWRIECVFDGFGRKASGNAHFDGPGTDKVPLGERSTKITDTGRGVRVCYSGIGASADSYIEKRCLDAKDVTKGKLTGSLIVVSNDAMIKLVGTSAGALCMSSDRFVDELKAVKKITQYRVEAAMAMVNGEFVRPESLRGASGSTQSAPFIRMQGAKGPDVSDENEGVQVVSTLRGGQFVIEDKRLRRKMRKTRGLHSLNETSTSEITRSSLPQVLDKDDDR
jgi:predicted RNA-binding protein with PIN domain